jgi:hypothetical protein
MQPLPVTLPIRKTISTAGFAYIITKGILLFYKNKLR